MDATKGLEEQTKSLSMIPRKRGLTGEALAEFDECYKPSGIWQAFADVSQLPGLCLGGHRPVLGFAVDASICRLVVPILTDMMQLGPFQEAM